MGYFEQIPSDHGASTRAEQGPEHLPIEDNRVQIALMKRWSMLAGYPESDGAYEWVKETGPAARFRGYAQENPGEEIDINNDASLERLLKELKALPQSDETVH